MAAEESVQHFGEESCENLPAEQPRDTTDAAGNETSAVSPGFDNNLSDVPPESDCQYLDGGKCEGITGSSPVPACLSWTLEDVADWVESIGFPLYRVRIYFNIALILSAVYATFNC